MTEVPTAFLPPLVIVYIISILGKFSTHALINQGTAYTSYMRNHKYIYYLIGATIVLVIISTIFYLIQSFQYEKNYDKTFQTIRITETADQLLLALKDAETGQRGYLLTGNRNYLSPYLRAQSTIDKKHAYFLSLLSKKRGVGPALNELSQWIEIKRNELNLTIRLYDRGEREKALTTVNSGRGKHAMEQIERLITRITAEEKSQLFKYNESSSQLNDRIQVFTIAGSYMLLVIIIASLVTIIQNREQINKLFKQLDDKNKQLEARKDELQNISHELIKQNGELERFAYIASHDLRSPGINLKSLLELYERSDDQVERAELFDAMKEVSAILLNKLDDLIKLLRSNKGPAIVKEDLVFEEVYTKLLKGLSIDIKNTQARLDHDFSRAPGIRYPKSYLESIMQNLLSNAIKYRHPDRPPHIRITTYRQNKSIYLKVEDNGLGIDLKQYGQRMFGLHQTFHDNKDSRGIGLYITRAQVLAMGGSIKVESEPGNGTTFTVCLG